ncbi:poly(A) RNA polymerase gld-2 homolog B-like isoform X2 [Anopheles ziemanni]|uniref:poly(A) RNA polymerase gld-2 homolog B-like isoform X2 n=1 Tax=Anopheles coustani TaxID=139045 RepID=UPI002658BCA3|nr:poly(A) RNA polymerase gld-2 homolog B-like isoform X2 [Anopheles coustani]XP_058174802.1 poly(A) RNA polymerase gld-2 homolog B-like isoform X2 [Anopheles ziemanni]
MLSMADTNSADTCMEAMCSSYVSAPASVLESVNHGIQEGEVCKTQLKSKSAVHQLGNMPIMYGTSKSKKCYNNSSNRKKQNQQQILNSLKSWNVKIAPSGLDKPEAELLPGRPVTIVQENSSYMPKSITQNQTKPQSSEATPGAEDPNHATTFIKEQPTQIPEPRGNNSSTMKKKAQDIKHNKSKHKEIVEKMVPSSTYDEERIHEKKDLESFTSNACENVISQGSALADDLSGHSMLESSSNCSSDTGTLAEDNDCTKEAVLYSSVSSGASVSSRGNCHKNSHSKARVPGAGWGWNHRQSQNGSSKGLPINKMTAAAGQVMEKTSKFLDGMPRTINGKQKDSSHRSEHHIANSQSFSPRALLTIHPNQQPSHHHPSYIHLHEQPYHQYLDHNNSAQQNSNGSVHQYSFDFLRDVGQKVSIPSDTIGSSSSSSSQVNYNFTPQFQQQIMQHYHNNHMLHQQNSNIGHGNNIQLHHAVTQQQQQHQQQQHQQQQQQQQQHQQQQHQSYINHSSGAYGSEEVACLLSPQSGGNGSTSVLNEPKYYQNYPVLGTGEMQNGINSCSQIIEHSSYGYNRNGDIQHQQQQQQPPQQGVNQQHPMYQNNHQQYQVHINSYHQNNNYQYHNRNLSAIRGNHLNYLVHGGGVSYRDEGVRNGKKTSWNSNGSKGKMGTALTSSGKHLNKVQSNGYGYRKYYQHYHNHHSVGGGHGQYYDHVAMSHQQQQSIPQQHHKQQHLHRNLVYVRGYDRGHGAVLPPAFGEDARGVGKKEQEAESSSSIHRAPSSPKSKDSLDMDINHTGDQDKLCTMADPEDDIMPCGIDVDVASQIQEKSVLPDDEEFELKELCDVPRSSSSSSMVSIPSTESSVISSTISQTQLLECTNASIHEYDSDSSHYSDFHDGTDRYSKYGQISCGQVYRSSSSTSGISSSATNPHSNDFIPSIPSSLRASPAALSELIVRSHSYHGSHQNLTAYGSVRSAGEASSPIGSPTGTLRSSSGTQSVPIFGELFASNNANNHNQHSKKFTGSHSSTVSFGSSSSLEMALRSSSSSLPASSVPPNDGQSMQSGHPRKRQSGRTSPAMIQEQFRPAVACYSGHNKGQGQHGNNGVRKSNQLPMNYVHRTSLPTDFQYTPADRFILRANDIELKIPPGRLSNGSVWDRLSEGIWEKFCGAQQTAEKYLQKMQLWRDLYICIKQGFPKYGLYLVGSTISGFGADNSDVDMCLVSRYTGPGYYDARNEALQNLTLVKNFFVSLASSTFDKFCLIQAKVPILRFQDSNNGIEVDLNYNNCVGIRNTHLLHCYSQMDWRVRPLVLVVKLWAQHHNINDAKNMTISSYSLVLMVIHFLQYGVKPSVLPCLHSMHPEKFMKIIDINSIEMIESIEPYQTDNKETLGELLLHFLEYYKDFDYAHYAISVRMASIIPIEECRMAKSYKNDPHQWKHLCIEEPFDLTNTARSVFDGEVFEQIKCTFAASCRMLKDTKDLSVLFGEPLFTPVTSTLSMTS